MKRVLITGGTGSLGSSIVKCFSENGNYDVVFTYFNNFKKADELSKAYNAKGHKLDLSTTETFGCDVLINNAAIVPEINYTENVTLANWQEVFDVNLTLPFQLIKSALSNMKKNKWGRIINISSIYGLKAEAEMLAYNASKHGLIGLTKTVSKEYAEHGITCNAICPGTINSDLSNRIADIYSTNEQEKETYFKELCSTIPAGRLVEPDEIAKTILFLASDDAAYINGATIVIDGAQTC